MQLRRTTPYYKECLIVDRSFNIPSKPKSAVGEEWRCELVVSNPGCYAPSTIYGQILVRPDQKLLPDLVLGPKTAARCGPIRPGIVRGQNW